MLGPRRRREYRNPAVLRALALVLPSAQLPGRAAKVQAVVMDEVVGRAAECAALRAALQVVLRAGPGDAPGGRLTAGRSGRAPVVLVTGEAGAGKTTLVEHVLATAPARVLRGRAAAWAARPYEVVASALRPVVRGAAGPFPAVLAQVLPELGAPPAEPSPAALAAAVCSVLATPALSAPALSASEPAAAAGGGLTLFLDDLQWADEASLDLLAALADAADGLPVALVGCYRSDELPRGHRLRAVRALLRRNHRLAEIELGPLGDDDVRKMLAGLWGTAPQPALAAMVASRADGLPFAVEELALALRDSGRLAYRDGTVTLAGTLAGPDAAPVPEGIREAVLLRASRLADDERVLLETAAVAGTEFDVDAVVAAAGAAGWPDGFTGSGLLAEARDGRAAFRHPLTQEAAYSDIPWSRRRRLHRALAAALAGRDAAPALIAAHHLAARDFGPAREALVAAAAEHYAVHAYRDAARTLRTALEHWPPGEQDDARLAAIDRLARCAEMCSEYADAVMLLRELADGHDRRGDRRALAACCRRLALAHELRGQWESALTAREAAAAAFAAAGIPAEAATDRLAMATHLRSAASFAAALATLTAAAADARACGRADLRLRVQGLRGNVLARMGQAREGIAVLREALDSALAQSLPDTAAELQQRLADAIEHSGDYRAAKAAYAAAYQYCDAHGADAVGQLCRACVSAVLFARGEWDRTAGVCQDVLASAAAPHARAVGAGLLGLVHAMRGTARLARPHLLDSHLTATRIELTAMELISSWGLCVLADAAGAHGDAADRGRQILARLARTQERHYSVPILQWLATFFTTRGLAADASACAAALAEIAEATAQPEAIAALAHARGETLLSGQPSVAVGEFGKAAEMFGRLDLPLQTAQSQRRAAAAAARLGEPARARDLLDAAHATAARLGARHLRESCAAELGELGVKPRRPVSSRRATAGPVGLTRRELDVMRLVAHGDTSRQIGSALFISPRTVEMHVNSSLQKLQCRTRAEAVRRLTELGALPHQEKAP
jgi:DNA-binding CsgD family transcriptional regulator/tetratricopeptide (TPR) repeat protein